MAFRIPDVGKVLLLEDLLPARLEGALMHLYKNQILITPATVLGDFQECDFGGYMAIALVGWGPVSIDGTGHAVSAAPPSTFTPTAAGGSGGVAGYFLTDAGGGDLIGAEAFADAPVNVAQFANLVIDHTFTTQSEF